MMKRVKNITAITGAAMLLLSSCPSLLAQGKVQLKVLCYNMMSFEGENKALNYNVQPIMDMVKYYDPDIVCFQEFETDNARVTYPASNDAVEKLTEAAEKVGMFPYFGYSYDKTDHPSHKGTPGYYGNALMSKYPIVEAHSLQLPFVGWDKYPQYGSDQRSVQYVEILVPTDSNPNGVRVRIVNTHLDHKYGQNEQAVYLVSKVFDPSIPALLMGDMNGGPSSNQIKTISAVCERVCEDTPGTYGSGGSKLDYIFSYPKGAWSVVSYNVVKKNGNPGDTTYPDVEIMSDHRPLVAVVELK